MNLQKRPTTNALKYRDKAAEMSRLITGSTISRIRAGRILIDVQRGFKTGETDGGFLEWLDYNFEMTKKTAYRWIEKTHKFQGIGMSLLETMHPTALGIIAAADCPNEITEQALAIHGRTPIKDTGVIRELMQEHEIQNQKGETKGIDRQRTAKHIINYISEIEPTRYTDEEREKMKSAFEKKLG